MLCDAVRCDAMRCDGLRGVGRSLLMELEFINDVYHIRHVMSKDPNRSLVPMVIP